MTQEYYDLTPEAKKFLESFQDLITDDPQQIDMAMSLFLKLLTNYVVETAPNKIFNVTMPDGVKVHIDGSNACTDFEKFMAGGVQ